MDCFGKDRGGASEPETLSGLLQRLLPAIGNFIFCFFDLMLQLDTFPCYCELCKNQLLSNTVRLHFINPFSPTG